MKVPLTFQKMLLGMLLLTLQSCGNDWPTKEQVKDLKGEWRLISIKATDKTTLKDTTWSIEGGFIRFGYTGKEGANPFTYALTSGHIIKRYYSVPYENKLLLTPGDPFSDYQKSPVGLPITNQNPFELSKDRLIITGDCMIRIGNENLTSGRRMDLIAVFER